MTLIVSCYEKCVFLLNKTAPQSNINEMVFFLYVVL